MSQMTINVLIGISTLIGAVIAPTVYIGDIKQTNAVQANQISTLESNYSRLERKIDEQNEKLNTVLIKLGVNPEKITR